MPQPARPRLAASAITIRKCLAALGGAWRGLVLLVLLGTPRPAGAQIRFDACLDRDMRPIRARVDNTMGYAGVATIEQGEPVIIWNQRLNERASRTTQLYVYLHECAHHTLHHVTKSSTPRWEREADCWAVQLMVDGGMIRGRHFRALAGELRTVRGDHLHLGGEALVVSLQRCLDVRRDPAAWHAYLQAVTAATADSFLSIRGDAIGGEAGIYESTLDAPGTYDCEVFGLETVRCMVFAARGAKAVEKRYLELVRIIRGWLPAAWTWDEPTTEPPPITRQFLAQDGERGTVVSLVATDQGRLYLVVKRGEGM